MARSRVERTIPFWPLERIERLQRYRLRRIIRHAYETVPFYRQAIDERGLRPGDFRTVEDLASLPLIDGLTVQRDIELFLSESYTDRSRQRFHSAGCATGVRRLTYWDSASVLRKVAYHARDQAVLSKLVRQSPYDHVHITPSNTTGLQLQAFWQARIFKPRSLVQHHTLSVEQPFEIIAEQINALQPQVASSYGSFAEQFFRFLADRQMTIALPRIWLYGGDMLSANGRELIENTFGCPTYSTYQSTETGRLGFQCEERQGFHLNIDLCAVRLVDDDGRTVEPGESGEVIISNLHNRAMVLLNYRLGDRAVLRSAPCPCGRSLPALERLEGRSSEVLYLADGRGVSGLTLETLCRQELRPTLQIQFVQPAPGHIQWRIVPFSSADRDTLRRKLLERCRAVLGEDTKVEVEFVEEIPTPPHGKFLRVVALSEESGRPRGIVEG
jgi:phenylacetate-CoA ligase